MSEPIHDENPKRSEATLGGLLRLGCCHCDRDDVDGVASFPTDWTKIQEVKKRGLGIWETHLGVCPNCQRHDVDGEDDAQDGSPPWEETTPEPPRADSVHPIIKQIIDRDCHVATPAKEVVRHVISKLRKGYATLRAMPQTDRDLLVEQCVLHHRGNFKEYVEVMSGFTQTVGADLAKLPSALSGAEIVSLMRKHKVTIEALAFRLGTTQKRVRKIRNTKLDDPLAVRDWIQAITGEDPGPIPQKVCIHSRQEEGDCCFCACPLYFGEDAYEYVGSLFCSITCCRQSRGW